MLQGAVVAKDFVIEGLSVEWRAPATSMDIEDRKASVEAPPHFLLQPMQCTIQLSTLPTSGGEQQCT